MSGAPAPVAFVHDRCASRSYRHLEMRMIGCESYIDRIGWSMAGRWIDAPRRRSALETPVRRRPPSSAPRDRPAAAPSTPEAGRTTQTPVPAG